MSERKKESTSAPLSPHSSCTPPAPVLTPMHTKILLHQRLSYYIIQSLLLLLRSYGASSSISISISIPSSQSSVTLLYNVTILVLSVICMCMLYSLLHFFLFKTHFSSSLGPLSRNAITETKQRKHIYHHLSTKHLPNENP